MRRIRPEWYVDSATPAPAAPDQPSSSCTSRASVVAARPSVLSSRTSSSARPAPLTAAPQPTPFTTRADAPVVRHVRRGSAALAVELLQKRGLDSLTDDLRHDKMARTSVGPAASTWKTWQGFHVEAFGSGTPTLPVTPESIVAVGSLFKGGDFARSRTTPPRPRTPTSKRDMCGRSCTTTHECGSPAVPSVGSDLRGRVAASRTAAFSCSH